MSRLALHIIAKDEFNELQEIILNYGKYFDEICIAYDEDDEGMEQLKTDKVSVYKYKWRDDFAHKRNFLVDKTKSEYYFRLDTDDVIENPEKIREMFSFILKNGVDVLYVPYIYSIDKDGNCNAKHWRETIIRKSKNHYWKKSVHENIYVEDKDNFRGVKNDSIRLIHNIDARHADKSSERNFKILLNEYENDKEDTDIRTLAYLGRMFMGKGLWDQAIFFLNQVIEKSGWDDDRYFAYVELSHCFLSKGNVKEAVSAANEALILNPVFPDSYIALCEIYITSKEYRKAIEWGEIALRKKEPDTMQVTDPSRYKKRIFMNMAIALLHSGHVDKAKKFFDEVYAIAPNDSFISANKKIFEEAVENKAFMDRFLWMYKYTKMNDPKAASSLVDAVPSRFRKDERVIAIRNNEIPPKQWGGNEVAIYCYNTLFEWGPPSVISGVGGSEEAVIYLSQELQKMGWKVTVYCNCGDLEGEYSGVIYKQYYEFNKRDSFNVLISWRQNMFYGQIKAKRKLVWLHDVPDENQAKAWFKETDVDKVIVLSEFHKTVLPDSFDKDKLFVSANGINMKDFKDYGLERNPYRMIYTSSYDRGIQHLLLMWKDIKKEVPEAELHLFYGWNTYDKFVEAGVRPIEYKNSMVKLMSQDGIKEWGRIGHKQLVKEFQKSKFWVYPSHFEEISCISAMKAQASGCVPVVTGYAALNETVKDGVVVPGRMDNEETFEAYKKALIKALKDQPKINIDKEQFSWAKVAKQWSEELFSESAKSISCASSLSSD